MVRILKPRSRHSQARYMVVDIDTGHKLRPNNFSNLMAAFRWGDKAFKGRNDKDFQVIDHITGEVMKRSAAIDDLKGSD